MNTFWVVKQGFLFCVFIVFVVIGHNKANNTVWETTWTGKCFQLGNGQGAAQQDFILIIAYFIILVKSRCGGGREGQQLNNQTLHFGPQEALPMLNLCSVSQVWKPQLLWICVSLFCRTISSFVGFFFPPNNWICIRFVFKADFKVI